MPEDIVTVISNAAREIERLRQDLREAHDTIDSLRMDLAEARKPTPEPRPIRRPLCHHLNSTILRGESGRTLGLKCLDCGLEAYPWSDLPTPEPQPQSLGQAINAEIRRLAPEVCRTTAQESPPEPQQAQEPLLCAYCGRPTTITRAVCSVCYPRT